MTDKFISWNYDNNTATEWLRTVACNHCGECCLVMIYIADLEDLVVTTDRDCEKVFLEEKSESKEEESDFDVRDGCNGTNGLGVWYEYDNGQRRFWKVKIDHNTPVVCFAAFLEAEYKDCSDGKGLICTAWPLHPDQVECFDNCSYSFVKLKEWEIE